MNRNLFLLIPALAVAALLLAGCETFSNLGKRIDYKSASSAPSLEIPPDLATPEYDNRYSINTATGLAAQNSARPQATDVLPVKDGDARIVREGNERWLVVKATPEQAWQTCRRFWTDTGFVIAKEDPALGTMETDWAENRADIPTDPVRKFIGKYVDLDPIFSTYRRDKFRTRIEHGSVPGTVEIFISHRGMEQVPTARTSSGTPAGFQWGLMPPNPGLEAEMLARLMERFGTPEAQAVAAVSPAAAAAAPPHAMVKKGPDGVPTLTVDDPFDRAWRRVGLALDRSGFTVVDRDRSKGLYYVRYADPDAAMARKDRQESWLAKLFTWWKKDDESAKPEQYRIRIVEASQQSTVSVLDPDGTPDKTQASERILDLLQNQLK
ncbi:MAG: outer membrane protein assembly factor BamC [Proteobacteria bacterium]|jgi:outer membrane protein assembly factor BamC|nr:outer membrane protein assembly factor BamC [Pseudomonadota bacterium]